MTMIAEVFLMEWVPDYKAGSGQTDHNGVPRYRPYVRACNKRIK